MTKNKTILIVIAFVFALTSLAGNWAFAYAGPAQNTKEVPVVSGKPVDASKGRAGFYTPSAFNSGTLEISRPAIDRQHGGRGLIFGSQRWLEVRFMDTNSKEIKAPRGFTYVYFKLNSDDQAAWEAGELSIYAYDPDEKNWVECPTHLVQDKSARFGRVTCLASQFGLFGLATSR